jgi:hypothetical protein
MKCSAVINIDGSTLTYGKGAVIDVSEQTLSECWELMDVLEKNGEIRTAEAQRPMMETGAIIARKPITRSKRNPKK